MRRSSLGILLSLAALALPARTQAAPPQEVFALVVAYNRSVDPTLPVLRYADDDGARFYELISSVASGAVLLTVLDAETQRLHPGLAGMARRPTRAEVGSAMSELSAGMRRARQRGARTAFYFYFAGHGDVGGDRQGYINLHDGRFSRSDLYREILAASPADANHVIIDACNSYFLVSSRGDRGARASHVEAIRSFLSRESLERYPNTGVILSTASVAESHEWSRYRSGIFSHQLISALWGAADVNGDRQVDYRELSAYVAAANLQVRDPQARLSIFARPPRSDRSAALVDLRAMRRAQTEKPRPAMGRLGGFLRMPLEMSGRYYLEDDRGIRHADFHKSGEQPLTVALLDRPYYYLRSDDREAMIRLETSQDVDAARLAFAEIPMQSRGAIEQSFRRDLYAVPFGRSFASGHAAGLSERQGTGSSAVETLVLEQPARPWYGRARTWKWASAGAAGAALALGITYQLLAQSAQSELANGEGKITMVRAVELQESSKSRQTAAGLAFGIAGTAAVTSVVLFLLDREEPARRALARPSLGAMVVPGGGTVALSGSF